MRRSHAILMAAAGATLLFEALPFRPVVVKGASMEPTYRNGSVVLGTRSVGELRRGDIVVVRVDGKPIIKRVAFLPGESFTQIHVAYLWINAASDKTLETARRHGWPERTITVPPGRLFLVGDNPVESNDSRAFGPVPLGAVLYRIVNPRAAQRGPCFVADGPGKPGYNPGDCA